MRRIEIPEVCFLWRTLLAFFAVISILMSAQAEGFWQPQLILAVLAALLLAILTDHD